MLQLHVCDGLVVRSLMDIAVYFFLYRTLLLLAIFAESIRMMSPFKYDNAGASTSWTSTCYAFMSAMLDGALGGQRRNA